MASGGEEGDGGLGGWARGLHVQREYEHLCMITRYIRILVTLG